MKKPVKPKAPEKKRPVDPNEDVEMNKIMNGLGETVEKKDQAFNKRKSGQKDNLGKLKTTGMTYNVDEDELKKRKVEYDKNMNANAIAFDDEDLKVDPEVDGKEVTGRRKKKEI